MLLLLFIFILVIGVQAAFLVAFLLAIVRKSIDYDDKGPSLSVSIVVCAHNELSNLKYYLFKWLEQDYPDFELIIVDDRSTDGSFEFLERVAQENQKLKIVRIRDTPEGLNSKKYALTRGIQQSEKEIILLTDADSYPATKNWCKTMASCFKGDTQIVLGYSPYIREKGWLNAFIRYETFITGMQYLGMALLGMPYMGVGRNLAYRRSLFANHGGFEGLNEITGGDDDLFVNRHTLSGNTRVCLDSHALVYSRPKTHWFSFYLQKLRHLSVGKRYKTKHQLFLGAFSLSYILCWLIGTLILIINPTYVVWIIGGLAFRYLILMIAVRGMGIKLGDKLNSWNIFFLDIAYVFYYISTGLRALTIKKVKWMN